MMRAKQVSEFYILYKIVLLKKHTNAPPLHLRHLGSATPSRSPSMDKNLICILKKVVVLVFTIEPLRHN